MPWIRAMLYFREMIMSVPHRRCPIHTKSRKNDIAQNVSILPLKMFSFSSFTFWAPWCHGSERCSIFAKWSFHFHTGSIQPTPNRQKMVSLKTYRCYPLKCVVFRAWHFKHHDAMDPSNVVFSRNDHLIFTQEASNSRQIPKKWFRSKHIDATP